MTIRNKTLAISLLTAVMLCGASTLVEAAPPILHPFAGTEGFGNSFTQNISLLAQGRDGNLYGTAPAGGLNFGGTAFKINATTGAYTKLHDFVPANEGSIPIGGLTLGNDGNFYGTTFSGGTNNRGTIFRVLPNKPINQALELLHSFTAWSATNLKDGSSPYSSPVQGRDGNFYGTTYGGGKLNRGTVYKIAPNGTGFQVIYDFGQKVNNPDNPALPLFTVHPIASLILGKDGNFYGTTTDDSINSNGTGKIFRITPSGVLTVLHVFHNIDGYLPRSPLMQGTDGNLYGTTGAGGKFGQGTVFKLNLTGNKLTTLHDFQVCAPCGAGEVNKPYAGLVQTGDGTLYGVAATGGLSGLGGLFKITTAGVYVPVFDFVNAAPSPSAAAPFSTPMLHTNGKIYGMYNRFPGGIYRFDVGAPAFVKPIPDAATAGVEIGITGDFVGITDVRFNGISVPFVKVSDTYITVIVPFGSATGTIVVLKGTIQVKTIKVFLVLPTFTGFSPISGAIGDSIILTGTSLSQVTSVRFAGNKTVPRAQISVDNDSQLTVNVPVGAQTGKITIITKGGSAVSATNFKVLPTLSGITPSSGVIGSTVTITGASLSQTTAVKFGGNVAATFTVVNDNQLTANVPVGALTGKITITTKGGSVTSATNFTVTS